MLKIFNRETKTEAEIIQLTRMSNKIIRLTHENEILRAENARLNETITGVTQQIKEAIVS